MSQPINPTPAFGSEADWQQVNFEYLTGQLQRVRMLLERRILWLRHRWGAARGVEKGAETIVWLATLPASGPSGKVFRDKRELGW